MNQKVGAKAWIFTTNLNKRKSLQTNQLTQSTARWLTNHQTTRIASCRETIQLLLLSCYTMLMKIKVGISMQIAKALEPTMRIRAHPTKSSTPSRIYLARPIRTRLWIHRPTFLASMRRTTSFWLLALGYKHLGMTIQMTCLQGETPSIQKITVR